MFFTWTCHICGKERPDERISVLTKPVPGTDGLAQQNMRYCNDDPECAVAVALKPPIDLSR